MQNLQTYLIGAFQSQNNVQRSQFEAQLIQLRQLQAQYFLFACSQMMNKSNNIILKKYAATVLGRSSITKNHNKIYYWEFCNSETKQRIRDNILSALVEDDAQFVKITSNTISQIASLQIAKGNWLDLIDIFAQNVQHTQFKYRKAAIQTIGNLCEQLKFINAKINQRSCQQFLASCILGIKDSNIDIKKNALKALRNSISFLKPILQNKQIRFETFKLIIVNMQVITQLTRLAYECLYQFIKSCYYNLEQFLNVILEITLKHILLRNQLATMALQVWETIGGQYLEICQSAKIRIMENQQNITPLNYLNNLVVKLLPQILKCMLILSENDIEFVQLRQSSSKLLSTFAQCCKKDTIDQITTFVSRIIQSTNPGQRQASALIFSSICDYGDQPYIKKMFENGFNHLFALLSDTNIVVIKNTLIGFIHLFQKYSQVPLYHLNSKQIISKFFELASCDDQDICLSSLICLSMMTDQLNKKDYPIRTQPQFLLPKVVDYFQKNVNKFNNNLKQANQKTIIILLNMIIATDKQSVLLQLINFAIEHYKLIIQQNTNDSSILANSMVSIIHTCLLQLRNKINDGNLMEVICQMVDLHINKFGIDSQALALINALTISFNAKFGQRYQSYWLYVQRGLSMVNDKQTFKNAIICVGDFARLFKTKFQYRAKKVLQIFIQYMHSGIGRQQKVTILFAIGDILLCLGQAGLQFNDKIIQLVNSCFNAIYELQNQSISFDYIQQLKQALLDMYQCMVFGLNSSQQKKCNEKVFNHFPIVASFIVRTCDPSLNPTVDYLKTSLLLIFDISSFFWHKFEYRSKIDEICQSNQIKRLINILQNIKGRSDLSQLFNLIYCRKMMN